MDVRTFTSNGIPTQFSITTYDVCGQWAITEWASALSERMFARRVLTMDKRLRTTEGSNDLRCLLLERSEYLMTSPLYRPGRETLPFGGRSSPLRDQSALQYFEGHFTLSDKRYAKFAEMIDTLRTVDWDSPEAREIEDKLNAMTAWEMHQECEVRDDDGYMLAIDLGASDELLVDEFKLWLKATRAAAKLTKLSRPYSKSDFQKWHEMRFLAYLDLTFWAAVRDGHFTLPVLGRALFPNEFGNLNVEDRVRKVVAPGALAIVSEESVSALNAQRLEAERK